MTASATRPALRSRLYVPGTKTAWLASAVASGADAIIFDLEDAVDASDKAAARRAVAGAVEESGGDHVIFVRVNELRSPLALDDLEAVVRPGLCGVVVPKVEDAHDVAVLDRVLTWLESRHEMVPGSVVVSPILETATALVHAHDLAAASERVDYTGGIATHGGDIERAIGYRWSRSAAESVQLRAAALVAVRAGGVSNPLTGVWTDLSDPEGLEAFAVQSRDLGYRGMDVIHPSHVETVHAVFSPDPAQVAEARAILAAAAGTAAARHADRFIDKAMVRTAEALLRQAGELP